MNSFTFTSITCHCAPIPPQMTWNADFCQNIADIKEISKNEVLTSN